MRPVAVVTGATGQCGSYLCEFLLKKGYHVKCLVRRSTYPIQTSNLKPYLGEVSLYEGDMLDQSSIFSILSDCRRFERIEVYNLAGQSHVGTSYDCPKFTFEVNTLGILNILETVRQLGIQNKCRIYQASSSEMFGNVDEHPQNESTFFNPQTLYGVSKVAAHCLIKNYREMYGLYACSGILYNHESPRRGNKFVTQKIIQGLKSGKCFEIGNLESRRDWGHARDYVEAMWIALQQDKPDDYVVATGKTHSVREFIEIAVNKMNKTIIWSGKNENEYGTIDGEVVVKVSKAFYRPYDVGLLVGDSSKIEKLGWSRKYDIDGLIEDMLKNTE